MLITDSTRCGLHPRVQPATASPRRRTSTRSPRTRCRSRWPCPEAMPTGPGAPRAAHRRALVPVPQLRADQGPAGRPRLDPDPRHLADRHRGRGRGRHRDRLLHRQPVPDRPALRQLPPHRRLGQAELLPGRLPLPQQALQAARDPQPDRALPAARAVRQRRGRPAALDGRLELDLPRQRPPVPRRARDARRDQPDRRPQEEAPVLPRRGLVRPARAVRRPAGLPARVGQPEGHRDDRGDHADPALRDALLLGRPRGPRRRDASSACASCTPPRSPTSTSGSGG